MQKSTVVLLLFLFVAPMYGRRDDDGLLPRGVVRLLQKIVKTFVPLDDGPLIIPPVP